uniref:Putative secreted protein n=1 Tax=Anopheles triannulatus TaxID=58253 RepID=A0A2M4B2J7_9DIPT
MSILPIFGRARSRILAFSVLASSFSCSEARISMMPVFLMNAGRSNGGFSIPRLPCRYFRLKHQWRGTCTVFRWLFSCTSSFGSRAVTSCISTTSGRDTSCFSSATLNRVSFFSLRLDILSRSSFSSAPANISSSSSSSFSLSAAFSVAAFWSASSPARTVSFGFVSSLKISNTR